MGDGIDHCGALGLVPVDDAQAMPWFMKALNEAKNLVGWSHEVGRGVGKNPALALLWYRKAVRQDRPEARAALARLEQE